jgi:hypothetical protein
MYAQVYHHKTVRAAEWMLIKTLRALRVSRAPGAPSRRDCRSRRAAGPRRCPAGRRLPRAPRRLGHRRARRVGRARLRPARRRSGAARSRRPARRSQAVQDLRSRRRPAADSCRAQAREVATGVAEARFGTRRPARTSRSTPPARSATPPPTTRSSTSSITRATAPSRWPPPRGHAARPADVGDPPDLRPRARRRRAPGRRARARARTRSQVARERAMSGPAGCAILGE